MVGRVFVVVWRRIWPVDNFLKEVEVLGMKVKWRVVEMVVGW